MTKPNILVVEGTHGVGKSTLLQQISKHKGAPIFKQDDKDFVDLAERAKTDPSLLRIVFDLQIKFMDNIKEYARDKELVLVDRWIPTTIVEQSPVSKIHKERCDLYWKQTINTIPTVRFLLMLGLTTHIQKRLINKGEKASVDGIKKQQNEYRALIPVMDYVYHENAKRLTVDQLLGKVFMDKKLSYVRELTRTRSFVLNNQ